MDEFRGHDVACREFSIRRRGYDPAEVGAHLAAVGAWVDTLLDRLAGSDRAERAAVLLLQKAQATADDTLMAAAIYADQERARAEAGAEDLLTTTRAQADELLRDGRERADGMVRDAQERAERALLEASVELTSVRRDVEAARRERAMIQASTARAVEQRAADLRRQAGQLLEVADELMAVRPGVEDALVVRGVTAAAT